VTSVLSEPCQKTGRHSIQAPYPGIPPACPCPYRRPGSKGNSGSGIRSDQSRNQRNHTVDGRTDKRMAGGRWSPQWSADGEAILLPSTFWKSGKPGPVRPCGALYWDVPTQRASCLSELQPETGESQYPEGFASLMKCASTRDDKRNVVLRFVTPHGKWGIWEYRQNAGGHWSLKKRSLPRPAKPNKWTTMLLLLLLRTFGHLQC